MNRAGHASSATLSYATPAVRQAVGPLDAARLAAGICSVGLAMIFGWLAVATLTEYDEMVVLHALQPLPGTYAGLCVLLNTAGLTWLYRSGRRTAGSRHPVQWAKVSLSLLGFYGGLGLFYASSVRYAFVHLELFVDAFASLVCIAGVGLFCSGVTPRRIA